MESKWKELIDELSQHIQNEAVRQILEIIRVLHSNKQAEIPLSLLFSALKFDHSEIAELSCTMIERQLMKSTVASLVELQDDIQQGLKHPNPQVRKIAIKAVGKIALSVPVDIIVTMMECLVDSDVGVAELTSQEICKLPEQVLNQDTIKTQFSSLLNRNDDIVVMRALDTGVQMLRSNPRIVSELGILDDVLANFSKASDPLLMMNHLQLMQKMASFDAGQQLLFQYNIPTQLIQFLQSNDVIMQLAHASMFDVLAELAQTEASQLFDDILANILRNHLQNPSTQHPAANLVCQFALNDIKILEKMCQNGVLKMIGDFSRQTVDSELQIHALNIISKILCHLSSQTQTTSKWFLDAISPDDELSRQLFNQISTPFVPLRLAILHCMKNMATSCQGSASLLEIPGYVEFALDRSTESDIEGLRMKFGLIQNLVQYLPDWLDAPQVVKLKLYLENGPIYSPVQSHVMVEDSAS